jgi:hypothetical protein
MPIVMSAPRASAASLHPESPFLPAEVKLQRAAPAGQMIDVRLEIDVDHGIIGKHGLESRAVAHIVYHRRYC